MGYWEGQWRQCRWMCLSTACCSPPTVSWKQHSADCWLLTTDYWLLTSVMETAQCWLLTTDYWLLTSVMETAQWWLLTADCWLLTTNSAGEDVWSLLVPVRSPIVQVLGKWNLAKETVSFIIYNIFAMCECSILKHIALILKILLYTDWLQIFFVNNLCDCGRECSIFKHIVMFK